jgi:hypothetical protein
MDWDKPVRFITHPGLFWLLGGPIGGIATWLLLTIYVLVREPSAATLSFGSWLGGLLFSALFGWVIGFPAAIAAGLLSAVAVTFIRRRETYLLLCLAAGAAGGAAEGYFIGIPSPGAPAAALLGLIGALAALPCAWIASAPAGQERRSPEAFVRDR